MNNRNRRFTYALLGCGSAGCLVQCHTPTIGDKVDAYLNAEEVLTDKNGRFAIGKHTPISFRPGWIRGPDITIFYPGYGSYPRYHAAPKIPVSGTDELCERMAKEGWTIELRQFTTREERLKVLDGAYHGEVPAEKKPDLIRLINTESRSLGVPGYRKAPR